MIMFVVGCWIEQHIFLMSKKVQEMKQVIRAVVLSSPLMIPVKMLFLSPFNVLLPT